MNKNIVFMLISIALFIFGIVGLIKWNQAIKRNVELERVIDNQNMLIDVLKKSCEEE